MADSEAVHRDELADAIAENPEAVAEFVDRLDAVNELLDVIALGEHALSDEMVRELSSTGATLAESADSLATDETVALAAAVGDNGEDLADAMDTLVTLQRSGALDDLAEFAQIGALASSALSDEMVRTLASTGSGLAEVAQTASEDDTRAGVERLLDGVGAAEESEAERVGPLGMARALRDPEVQYGLGYLLTVAKAVGRDRAPADES
ncbi:DUF1641 domain-containing protein [Halobaculum marinum]|uniref:DUF1641 domain-containing protein n=1 Tax=Halobaculum marinum TaxID=3031996 RepID=A0ABD5WU73_9EURY|nr:DUF1641 domain-containing protein [Halobaculum sp. DT55]